MKAEEQDRIKGRNISILLQAERLSQVFLRVAAQLARSPHNQKQKSLTEKVGFAMTMRHQAPGASCPPLSGKKGLLYILEIK